MIYDVVPKGVNLYMELHRGVDFGREATFSQAMSSLMLSKLFRRINSLFLLFYSMERALVKFPKAVYFY